MQQTNNKQTTNKQQTNNKQRKEKLPMENTFRDHRGVETIGKPLYNQTEWQQMISNYSNKKKERNRQMINLSELQAKLSNTSSKSNAPAPAPAAIELKLNKPVSQEMIELTGKKIVGFEQLHKKLNDIELSIRGINSAIERIDKIVSAYNTEYMPQLFKGIQSLNDQQAEINKQLAIALAAAPAAPSIITRKKTPAPAADTAPDTVIHKKVNAPANSIEGLYASWRQYWQGSFCKDTGLNRLNEFKQFIAMINQNDLDKSFKSACKTQVGQYGYPIAVPGQKKALEGFKRAIGAPAAPSIDKPAAPAAAPAGNSVTIDSSYFVKGFGLDLGTVLAIKDKWIAADDTAENRAAITDFIRANATADLTDKIMIWSRFFSWLNTFKEV